MQAQRRYWGKGLKYFGLVAVVLFLAGAGSVRADSSFSFTFSDGTNVAYGLLQATDNCDGTFTATSGTLYVIGGPDVGTYSLYPNPFAPDLEGSPFYFEFRPGFIFDDLLYPGQDPALDPYGLLFTGNGLEINIWGNGPGIPYSFYSSNGSYYNVASDSGTFTLVGPAQRIQNLKAIVQALVDSGATLPANGNSLQVKLNAALGYLAICDTADAIGSLKAFVNQVKAFIKTGKLTSVQGQSLIDQANATIAALGG